MCCLKGIPFRLQRGVKLFDNETLAVAEKVEALFYRQVCIHLYYYTTTTTEVEALVFIKVN